MAPPPWCCLRASSCASASPTLRRVFTLRCVASATRSAHARSLLRSRDARRLWGEKEQEGVFSTRRGRRVLGVGGGGGSRAPRRAPLCPPPPSRVLGPMKRSP